MEILFSYLYNSQSVPEPDEFNSIHFDREKFIQSQQPIDYSFIKPKDLNLSFPFFPLWPFDLSYPRYSPTIPRKSFDIDDILDLSLHPPKKRPRLSSNEATN